MKERIKKFTKEHRQEIKIAIIGTVACVVCVSIGYKVGLNDSFGNYLVNRGGKTYELLLDAYLKHGPDGIIIGGTTAEGLKVSAMGELGKDIYDNVLSGNPELLETCEFTHFLMMGKK